MAEEIYDNLCHRLDDLDSRENYDWEYEWYDECGRVSK